MHDEWTDGRESVFWSYPCLLEHGRKLANVQVYFVLEVVYH